MKYKFAPVGFVCVCVVLAGCGGANYEGAERFPVAGQVTFNGEPVDRGSISFIPQDGDAQRVSGGAIADGKYSIPEEQGPNAGKYRVEIHWSKKTGRITKTPYGDEPEMAEAIPGEFHTNSTLTADITEAQTALDFDLKSAQKPSAKGSKIVTDYGPG